MTFSHLVFEPLSKRSYSLCSFDYSGCKRWEETKTSKYLWTRLSIRFRRVYQSTRYKKTGLSSNPASANCTFVYRLYAHTGRAFLKKKSKKGKGFNTSGTEERNAEVWTPSWTPIYVAIYCTRKYRWFPAG